MSMVPEDTATEGPSSPVVFDLRGIPCPLSWAHARVRLERIARGTTVSILLDDPRGARDLPRAAESVGHHLLEVEEVVPAREWRIRLEV